MVKIDDERRQGLERWRTWLAESLSNLAVVGKLRTPWDADGAGWWIGFRDDPPAQFFLTEAALRLSKTEFHKLTEWLDHVEWMNHLKILRPGGFRVHANGRLEELGAIEIKVD